MFFEFHSYGWRQPIYAILYLNRDAVTGASFSWSSFVFHLVQEKFTIFSRSKTRSQKIS